MSTGHSVKYEPVDEETAIMAFQALGLPEWLARGNVEMLQYFVQDKYVSPAPLPSLSL